ncbi:MAG: T9SS type A sorting domain-containing protein [Urechidicola sp.]|nr:T9SS type A sorting domain-containing protein [Urechidicola sp.]
MKKKYLIIILSFIVLNSWSQKYKKMIAEGTYTVQEIQRVAEVHFDIIGTERGNGYKPYKRWEYQALRNMDENGLLKTSDFYFNELERYTSEVNQKGDFYNRDVGNWEQLGPTLWNGTSGWNPGVGRITSISVDLTDTNHIIVGANTGGVWRSIDEGTNWTVLTDNLSNIDVYSLAIDPTNSSTYFWGSSDGAIFKSINSGATWNLLADTGNGRVNKILIDPTDVNKMYCSVESGGIFKSTNGGVDWSLINSSASNGYDIEFKPGDTNTIYASGNQFFKSTDGGLTFIGSNDILNWTQEYLSGATNWITSGSNQNNSVSPKTGDAMGYFYVGNFSQPETLLISPSLDLVGATNPKLKFSYTQVNWSGDQDDFRVLYKTSAGGSWIELAIYTSEVTSWTDVILDLPDVSSDYYIAFEGHANYGRGITLDDISVDGRGNVYFSDGFESATNNFSGGPKMIGVSADDTSVVYVLEASSGKFGGFHKSIDGGDSFTKLNHDGKNYFGYSSTADDDSGQAPRDMDITVNPLDINEVHIAGVLTWYSTDGGITFNVTSQWTPTNATAQNIGYCHADVDILEYINGKLYVGSDGGIFVADNPLDVNTSYYRDLTSGLGIRQFYKIGISQSNTEVISGGSQDNGTSVYDATGIWKDWLGADGMESFVDKDDNDILYGTSQNGSLYKSFDQGNSYNGVSRPEGKSGNWVTPFEQDPITQDVIYSGYDEVYKSVNGGGNWTSISQNFGSNLNHLKIAPSDNATLYASYGDQLYKTTDGGTTDWTLLTGFVGSINSIAVHPTDPQKVAIATTGDQKVYVSVDGGLNWISYLYDLPNFSASALVWENNANDGLYLGMNYGVYYIDSTTENSWKLFNNNLPNVRISELEINSVTSKIYAATYGRGLWKSNLYDGSLSIDKFELDAISVYPNPASNEINIVWHKNESTSVRIYNALGKLLFFSKDNNLMNPLKINTSQFSSGLYFIKFSTTTGATVKKVIIE